MSEPTVLLRDRRRRGHDHAQSARQAERVQRGDARRARPCARPDRAGPGHPGGPADRRRARFLRRPGSRRSGHGRRRRPGRPRRHPGAAVQPAGAPDRPSGAAGGRARSTASPPAPGPIWRSPATWSWRRARPSFIEPFCRLGLVPDAGGSFILPRLVGLARAKGMALLGEPVGAEQAEAWGLIWRAVDDDRLLDEATRPRPPSGDPADQGARA